MRLPAFHRFGWLVHWARHFLRPANRVGVARAAIAMIALVPLVGRQRALMARWANVESLSGLAWGNASGASLALAIVGACIRLGGGPAARRATGAKHAIRQIAHI